MFHFNVLLIPATTYSYISDLGTAVVYEIAKYFQLSWHLNFINKHTLLLCWSMLLMLLILTVYIHQHIMFFIWWWSSFYEFVVLRSAPWIQTLISNLLGPFWKSLLLPLICCPVTPYELEVSLLHVVLGGFFKMICVPRFCTRSVYI